MWNRGGGGTGYPYPARPFRTELTGISPISLPPHYFLAGVQRPHQNTSQSLCP
ncbi:hypothetical protein BC939DRAFT_451310, partial [Gamsiella multidivaricata]|uniref:uncharacterized protein n=1 Tax=Gamsiella multidivaricata TaxID=101098 RepID=UPI00221FE847